MASKAKTAKQKEFELMMDGTFENPYAFTKKLRVDKDIELIRKYRDKISWHQIARRNTLTNEFIEEFYDYLKPQFELIEVNPNISIDFLKKNSDYINWCTFVYSSNGNRFSVEFLEMFYKELHPHISMIINKKGLPEETREYLKRTNNDFLDKLSRNENITLKTLKQYGASLNWSDVSRCAKCLSKLKNFKMFEELIDMKAFTNFDRIPYYVAENRKLFLISKGFLTNYYTYTDIDWKGFFGITPSYSNSRSIERGEFTSNEDDNLNIDLGFFKKNYSLLPEPVRTAYDDFKKNYSINSTKSYYNRPVPWE